MQNGVTQVKRNEPCNGRIIFDWQLQSQKHYMIDR